MQINSSVTTFGGDIRYTATALGTGCARTIGAADMQQIPDPITRDLIHLAERMARHMSDEAARDPRLARLLERAIAIEEAAQRPRRR